METISKPSQLEDILKAHEEKIAMLLANLTGEDSSKIQNYLKPDKKLMAHAENSFLTDYLEWFTEVKNWALKPGLEEKIRNVESAVENLKKDDVPNQLYFQQLVRKARSLTALLYLEGQPELIAQKKKKLPMAMAERAISAGITIDELPDVIGSELTPEEEDKLLNIERKTKEAERDALTEVENISDRRRKIAIATELQIAFYLESDGKSQKKSPAISEDEIERIVLGDPYPNFFIRREKEKSKQQDEIMDLAYGEVLPSELFDKLLGLNKDQLPLQLKKVA